MFDSSAGSSLYNLGNLYGKLGRHHEALELEEKALELRKRIHPENHPAIGSRCCQNWQHVCVTHAAGDAMNNVAGTLAELGRHAEAVELFEKTLAFRQRILPENHPDIGDLVLLPI